MGRPPGRATLPLVVLGATLAAAACGPARVALPSGQWDPVPASWGDVFAEASAPCAGVRTLSAEIAVSGSAGGRKLRGRVLAGFARPGSMRLEAVAPFGPPFFILAAEGGAGTLLLPRDRQVLARAPASDILEALTGLSRTPDDLRAMLAGCVTADIATPGPPSSRDGWVRVGLRAGTEAYLRRADGAWRIVRGVQAAPVGAGGRAGASLTVDYGDFVSGFPRTVQVWQEPAGGGRTSAALVFKLSQVDTNVAIDAEAFRVVIPEGAVPITLEGLRRAGPLAATSREER